MFVIFTARIFCFGRVLDYGYKCGDGRVINSTIPLTSITSYSSDGVYNLSLKARDRTGAVDCITIPVLVDSVAPQINITSTFPNCSLGLGQQWPIEFSVADCGNNSSGVSNVTLIIEDWHHNIVWSKEMKLSENDSYSYLLPSLHIPAGYRCILRAVDGCGNTNESFFRFDVERFFGNQVDMDTRSFSMNGTLLGNVFSVEYFTGAENVSLYGKTWYEDNVSVKALLFRLNDSVLVGETETVCVDYSNESEWIVLDFVNTTFLHSDCDYALCAISNGSFLGKYQIVDEQLSDVSIVQRSGFESPNLTKYQSYSIEYLMYCNVGYFGY